MTSQIDAYNDEMQMREKEKLKETDTVLIIDYIKSSIEILLNLKLEEQEMNGNNEEANPKELMTSVSSIRSERSAPLPPKDYEAML